MTGHHDGQPRRLLQALRERLTYANVVASLALFIALGGTSYAVATGSVDSKTIENDSIRSKDIRNNQVRSIDVRNGTLLPKDLKGGKLPPGSPGPPGPPGPTFAAIAAKFSLKTPEQASPAPRHSFSFTIPEAGKVLVEARTQIRIECSSGVGLIGVWVDGVPLPESARFASSGPGLGEVGLVGLTNSLAPGQHRAELLSVCPDGVFEEIIANEDTAWSALLIGG